ncbi:MAG: kdsB [Ignavibacteria bacterium]|nr:kdsB [Ignavibacteria bacterium]
MDIKSNINAIGIIPARFSSERLPGKPLVDICGKPLIRRVWEGASTSLLIRKIYIATDDLRIAVSAENFGADVIMTPSELPSGTDRIAYAVKSIEEEADIIVNIQGDEPFITGEILDKLLSEFAASGADVGTLVQRIDYTEELTNPSVVKVVLSDINHAIYFSRSPVPHLRDVSLESWAATGNHRKHIGIYAYSKAILARFTELPQSNLEKLEKLEQLRLLEAGAKYYCSETDANLIGVDTEEDLIRVREIISKREQDDKYFI